MARRWTQARILRGLRRYYESHGYLPRSTDVAARPDLPSAATIRRRLGASTWAEAIRAAARALDIEPVQRPSHARPQGWTGWTPERTRRLVRDYYDEHGHFPLSSEMPRAACMAIVRDLGARGWEDAVERMADSLGLEPAYHPRAVFEWDRERVLAGLRAYHAEHGFLPRVTDLAEQTDLPSASTIQDRLGAASWGEAMDVAARALGVPGEMRPAHVRESSIEHPTPFRHPDGHLWVRDPRTGKKMRYARYLAQEREGRVLGRSDWVVQLNGGWDDFSEENVRVMSPQDYFAWKARHRS